MENGLTNGHSTNAGPTRTSSRPRMPSLAGREPQTLAELAATRAQPPTPIDYAYNDSPTSATGYSTRSRTAAGGRRKFLSKVKLKLGEKAAQGNGTSFLGTYDRELDTEDEEDRDLVFEEQFVLKVPEGEDCDKLRAMVQARAVTSDVWFKFTDTSRRGVFHIGNNTYTTKLVDLPCVIESYKTLDNKQMFKVADICQALVLGEKLEVDAAQPWKSKVEKKEDYSWPHGITPPLKWVRKRRFRKRIDKASIEVLEQQLERLAEADSRADQVDYTILENVNPDLPDSAFDIDAKDDDDDNIGVDPDDTPAATPAAGGHDLMDEDGGEGEGEGEDDDEDDLAAELERALAGEEESGGDDEEDEDEEDEESDEDVDEDEDAELTQARRLLEEEIQDLEAAVEKKVNEIASANNPIIKRRFEDALKKLRGDLEAKRTQIEALTAKPQDEEAEGMEGEGLEDDDEDLFADDDEDGEDEAPATQEKAASNVLAGDSAAAAGGGVAPSGVPSMVIQLPSS